MSEELGPEIYRTVLEGLHTGVYLVDRQRRIRFWNDGAERITGYRRHEVLGRACCDNLLTHCDENHAVLCGSACPLTATINNSECGPRDLFLLHKNGERIPVRIHSKPIRDERGAIIGGAESFEERVLRPGADTHATLHVFRDSTDEDTGILDQASFEAHLAAALEDYCSERVPFGVLCLEIDGMEELLKFHGRNAGPSIRRVVAQTLVHSVGPMDAVGRRGSAGFVVMVMGCPASALETVAAMLRRIVSRAAIPWWGDRFSVTVSAGGTAAREVDTVDVLLDRSEKALRMSVDRGGDNIIIV